MKNTPQKLISFHPIEGSGNGPLPDLIALASDGQLWFAESNGQGGYRWSPIGTPYDTEVESGRDRPPQGKGGSHRAFWSGIRAAGRLRGKGECA